MLPLPTRADTYHINIDHHLSSLLSIFERTAPSSLTIIPIHLCFAVEQTGLTNLTGKLVIKPDPLEYTVHSSN